MSAGDGNKLLVTTVPCGLVLLAETGHQSRQIVVSRGDVAANGDIPGAPLAGDNPISYFATVVRHPFE